MYNTHNYTYLFTHRGCLATSKPGSSQRAGGVGKPGCGGGFDFFFFYFIHVCTVGWLVGFPTRKRSTYRFKAKHELPCSLTHHSGLTQVAIRFPHTVGNWQKQGQEGMSLGDPGLPIPPPPLGPSSHKDPLPHLSA